ncbi:hypothetical protein BRAS3843_230024 [Bradyrhizobium sp. STM 3843]|uniref:hypothetical protein n=1 Tax=Bradyrhizobium sp. STM 3843 TaxID=551947 RepID=UPI00024031B1|nr:hypothetical protein [Bradyrhizobium sp. STM 3843]CCE07623.1 hypothetical protein BRAS3843_230024 [Bradyrhizobium sp. STM 3843]
MWKALWKEWTIDKPALLGDWLWEVLVVQLAALLDRLTLRKVIAFLPVIVVVLAYHHQIPLPPELMLVGDVLAYIDIVSVLLLLGILSRVTTILFLIKQATARIAGFTSRLATAAGRLDLRHRRESGARIRKRLPDRSGNDSDDEPIMAGGLAWA